MRLETSSESNAEKDVIMRSVHGDEVRMPYAFFERLRKFHNSAWPAPQLQETRAEDKSK